MEEVIRFLLARPAQRIDAKTSVVPVQPSVDYHDRLRKASQSETPREAVRRVALAQRESPDVAHALEDVTLGIQLKRLSDALAGKADMPLKDLRALVKKEFDVELDVLVGYEDLNKAAFELGDVIVTSSVLGREGEIPLDEAATLLRLISLLASVAAGDRRLEEPGGLEDALSRVLMLPGDVFPLIDRTRREDEPQDQPREGERIQHLTAERDRLRSTYEMLTRVAPEHLAIRAVETLPVYPPGVEAPLGQRTKGALGLPPVPEVDETGDSAVDDTHVFEQRGVETLPESGRQVDLPSQSGRAAAVRLVGAPVRLRPEVVDALGEQYSKVLNSRGLDLTRVSVPNATERLSIELQALELQLAQATAAQPMAMVKVGGSYLSSDVSMVGPVTYGGLYSASVPTTYGSVAPAGIGDLLVVRQNLKRYEGRELSHIENILKGEFKERVHKRARTTEETITTETETKKEEERDQQTTERFELKHESSLVQKEDESLKAGLSLSGKYGPIVEFKATTDFALNRSKEEASKVATSYSKDVTSRATTRIFERHVEQRILKTIEVFEETNTHGVDNKAGLNHIVGQYQWVDKVYEAQVFNYGKRLLYEITLPEPAAFLLYATASAPKAGADLIKPVPFTLKPSDISEWNYSYYVQQYQAVGVTPPPPPFQTVAKALEGKGTESEGATKAAEVPITDGYQAISAHVSIWFNGWSGNVVDVALGNSMHRFSNNGDWSLGMGSETGTVPFALKTWKAEAFVVAVEIACQRTQLKLDDWRLKTHTAILQAWQKMVRDYEEQLAALQVEAAQQFQGTNPLQNEALIRAELKKGAISTFSAQHFDLFGAIATSSQGYPEPDLQEAAAEGRYIRFFEQAFEWEQMTYFFYPYYWGRKSNWLKRVLVDDVDPLFAEFLKAGSARLVVSVRVGFEHAVAHFLETGQIWDGSDLPAIGSPLYVSIIEEIRERDKAPGTEVAQGDWWDVHLPTTLLLLRDKAPLPSWQKDGHGDWQPV